VISGSGVGLGVVCSGKIMAGPCDGAQAERIRRKATRAGVRRNPWL
jgi:hypothetical protein